MFNDRLARLEEERTKIRQERRLLANRLGVSTGVRTLDLTTELLRLYCSRRDIHEEKLRKRLSRNNRLRQTLLGPLDSVRSARSHPGDALHVPKSQFYQDLYVPLLPVLRRRKHLDELHTLRSEVDVLQDEVDRRREAWSAEIEQRGEGVRLRERIDGLRERLRLEETRRDLVRREWDDSESRELHQDPQGTPEPPPNVVGMEFAPDESTILREEESRLLESEVTTEPDVVKEIEPEPGHPNQRSRARPLDAYSNPFASLPEPETKIPDHDTVMRIPSPPRTLPVSSPNRPVPTAVLPSPPPPPPAQPPPAVSVREFPPIPSDPIEFSSPFDLPLGPKETAKLPEESRAVTPPRASIRHETLVSPERVVTPKRVPIRPETRISPERVVTPQVPPESPPVTPQRAPIHPETVFSPEIDPVPPAETITNPVDDVEESEVSEQEDEGESSMAKTQKQLFLEFLEELTLIDLFNILKQFFKEIEDVLANTKSSILNPVKKRRALRSVYSLPSLDRLGSKKENELYGDLAGLLRRLQDSPSSAKALLVDAGLKKVSVCALLLLRHDRFGIFTNELKTKLLKSSTTAQQLQLQRVVFSTRHKIWLLILRHFQKLKRTGGVPAKRLNEILSEFAVQMVTAVVSDPDLHVRLSTTILEYFRHQIKVKDEDENQKEILLSARDRRRDSVTSTASSSASTTIESPVLSEKTSKRNRTPQVRMATPPKPEDRTLDSIHDELDLSFDFGFGGSGASMSTLLDLDGDGGIDFL